MVVLKHIVFVCLLAIGACLIPSSAFDAKSRELILVVGFIGVWRYSWGLLHLLRSIYFRHIAFPKSRFAAARWSAQQAPGHAYLLITSFRIDASTTRRVYTAAFKAAATARGGATVVCSIVERGDERLIRDLARVLFGGLAPFDLIIVRTAGTGKRDALAHGLRAIAARQPAANATVSLIDGDSIVPDNLVEKCAPFFALYPRLGALTTDEACTVEGAEIFKRWYSLRFAQRQVLMSSHGLARRVLTLTGRMSMFRAQLACSEPFIRCIQNDAFYSWRLGNIKMLTGDDKSTWFWLLKRNYEMHYVPDVVVETIEQPPHPGFLKSADVLMTRWFGNMLRTNSRAIALGPWRISFFTWWSVFDQRLSMWTSLSGLVLAIAGSIFVTPWTFAFYALWVLTSRYLLALSMLTARPSISLSYIPLLYFNQIYGSWVKIRVFFRLDQQRWTRQKTILATELSRGEERFRASSSMFVRSVAIATFISLLLIMSNLHNTVDAQASRDALVSLEGSAR
ncbi:MAG: glycosyltransferase [Pseudomonadota bacterium]